MNGSRYITIFVVLSCMIVIVHNTEDRAYGHVWVDGTPLFRENAVSLAQTLGHSDRAMLAPAIADVLPLPAYKLGDEHEFYATNMRNGAQYLSTGLCSAISDKAYIFVEKGVKVDLEKTQSLLTAFDSIYDTITGHFGSPPDSVDCDPRIYILMMDIIDDERRDGTRIMGYFDPVNQYQNDQLPQWVRWTRQVSNEIEMLYIDYTAFDLDPDSAEGVVAHEFTHLVQWARDPEEAMWIDEGIAVYTETMLGYEVEQRISAFEDAPDTPLLIWSDSLADYGAACLFFIYISERFGGVSAIAAIVKNGDQGTAGIENALAALGEPVTFSSLFSDWVIANYLDDPDLDNGVYGYSALDIHLNPYIVENLYPIDSKASMLRPWAAQYIEFNKGQDDVLDVTVSNINWRDDIVAQVIEFGDETSVSIVKSGEAASGSYLVSKEAQKAILVITSQPDPPELGRRLSSYAYSAETRCAASQLVPVSGMKITAWGMIKRD